MNSVRICFTKSSDTGAESGDCTAGLWDYEFLTGTKLHYVCMLLKTETVIFTHRRTIPAGSLRLQPRDGNISCSLAAICACGLGVVISSVGVCAVCTYVGTCEPEEV